MKSSVPNLEIIRDEAAFLALGPHWERLHQASAVHTPFRTWDWSRLWWKQYRDRCQLRIATDDGGREWMWVEVLKWSGGEIEGVLQNQPDRIAARLARRVVVVMGSGVR